MKAATEKPQPQYRVGQFESGCMSTIAIVVDGAAILINLVPFIGQASAYFITACGFIGFGIWFILKDISLVQPLQLLSGAGNLLGEMVTIGVWPGVSIAVVASVVISRIEDRANIRIPIPSKETIKKLVKPQTLIRADVGAAAKNASLGPRKQTLYSNPRTKTPRASIPPLPGTERGSSTRPKIPTI